MNKTYLIAGIAVVGFVVIGALFLKPAKTEAPVVSAPTNEEMNDQVTDTGMKMRHSMRELIAMNTPLQCTFVSGEGETRTTGVSYFAAGKVRTDVTGQFTGPENFNSIIDETHIYTWGSALPQGIKMSLATLERAEDGEGVAADAKKSADMDEEYDYNCTPWSVDTSVFVPPSSVTFMDYDQMMNGMQGMMQGLGNDAGMMEGMEPYNP